MRRSITRHRLGRGGRLALVVALVGGFLAAIPAAPAAAVATETITLATGSGGGGLGDADPNLTYAIQPDGDTFPAVIDSPVDVDHGLYDVIPGTRWVSVADNTASCNANPATDEITNYDYSFALPQGALNPSLDMQLFADNAGTVLLNGHQIFQQEQAITFDNFHNPSTHVTTDATYFVSGTNTLEVQVADYGLCNGVDYLANVTYTPAQADLEITSSSVSYVDAPAPTSPPAEGNLNAIRTSIGLRNNGPSDAQNAAVSETFPSQIDTATARFCVGSCDPSAGTLITPPHFTGSTATLTGTDIAGLAPFAANGTMTVQLFALVSNPLRNGALPGATSASITSDTTDPNPGNNQTSTSPTTTNTVPGAPTLVGLTPGNKQFGLQWTKSTSTGGAAVTAWDVVAVPTSGPTLTFLNVPTTNVANTSPPQLSTIVSSASFQNGVAYSVTVQARNTSGDSTRSNARVDSPCDTCVVAMLAATGTQNLSTTNPTPGSACPKRGVDGATAAKPFEGCVILDATQLAKAGAAIGIASQPVTGSPCGGSCLGNREIFTNPAGEFGTGPQVTEFDFVDKTIGLNVYGHLCFLRRCPSFTSIYTVYFTPNPHALPTDPNYTFLTTPHVIGSSLISTWCLPTIENKKIVFVNPAHLAKTDPLRYACILNAQELNVLTAPNGLDGIGDFQFILKYRGDPAKGLHGGG